MASAGGTKLSREEWKKKQELEAARKAGTVAPELDEDGKMINPHIPQYISDAPWYLNNGKPGLKHQKCHQSVSKEKFMPIKDNWYQRGEFVSPSGDVKKFKKGACENCGATTHSRKDCLERPRKMGAKWTGQNIAPDEVLVDVEFTWDGKRDRWNGYDPSAHIDVVREYEKIDEMKQKLKEKKLQEEYNLKQIGEEVERPAGASTAATEEEDFIYSETAAAAGQKFDPKARMTVRNLRMREDTAKYLRNLDPNSAYYDPKTHAMRDNPYGNVDPSNVTFAGDNFIRYTGDTIEVARSNLFAWEAAAKGTEVHPLADPTAIELHRKQVESKKSQLEQETQKSILEKYGGEEHLINCPPKELLVNSATEVYVEYDPQTGRVVKGLERMKNQSCYAEDIYPNNHTSVWGSFWDKHSKKWGFACCCSLIRNSYCVGKAGVEEYSRSKSHKAHSSLLSTSNAVKAI